MRLLTNSNPSRLLVKISVAFSLLASLNMQQAWAGQSQDCGAFGDASMICAPISQLAQTLSDGTPVAVSNGTTYVATSTKTLKFTFTSNSANSGKKIYLQFFDVSPGVSLGLPTPTCSSVQVGSNGCVTALDSSGSVTVPVTINGAVAGKFFKYQLNGPAGFTSGFVTTTFTSSGGAVNIPEICGGDSTTICAPITRVTATTGGKDIPVAYSPTTQDGAATISPTTTSITYKFAFPSDYMNKYVFVQFFDVTTLALGVPGGSMNSSTSCDPQPAANRGCKIQIDVNGNASFSVSLSNTTLGSSFKYIVAGPNYASHVVQTTVAVPPTISLVGGKAKFTVKIDNAKGQTSTVTYKIGKTEKTATLRINSNSALFNIPATKGSYQVKVAVGSFSVTKKIAVK